MNLKLSIVIPCYNCALTLREAINSCYTQGFSETEFEIVMVDDCSSDNTRQLIEQIKDEKTNVKIFFHSQNEGGGAARNTAIANANSDIIFCLDSDDILPPNNLKRMYDYLLEKDCDSVCFHHSINFKGRDINDISHIVDMSNPGLPIEFENLFQTKDSMCGLYQVFMFTKSAFNKTLGYPTTHGFDTQGFAWRFLAAGNTAYTCPDTTYLLRVEFKESYYLREYNQGKNNFNWQNIFLEHIYLFNQETQSFIQNYDCSDFTKDFFSDLISRDKILKDDYKSLIGINQTHDKVFINKQKSYPRNSFYGFYLRLKNKLKRFK